MYLGVDLDSERALLQQCLLWESREETSLGRARKDWVSLLMIWGRKVISSLSLPLREMSASVSSVFSNMIRFLTLCSDV